MDFHSILDHNSGETDPSAPETPQPDMRFPGEDGGKSLAEMAERDLTATLQLLAERAQYITGASGAAIALRDHEEMVCRASAGSSAPEVGAQLQVNSGLSGESVRTRQTLRCDDATTDERVNRESCEALGIRSVVVMPLLRGDEVIGVFELFSDQANIFETRDLSALERMGAMVHTALEHSAAALGLTPPVVHEPTLPSLPIPRNGHDPDASTLELASVDDFPQSASHIPANDPRHPAVPESDSGRAPLGPHNGPQDPSEALSSSGIAFHRKTPVVTPAAETTPIAPIAIPSQEHLPPRSDEVDILEAPIALSSGVAGDVSEDILLEEESNELAAVESAASTPVPQPAMAESLPAHAIDAPPSASKAQSVVAHLRKCEACGFPVSEGRTLCLDCEKKNAHSPNPPKTQSPALASSAKDAAAPAAVATPVTAALPNFLAGEQEQSSWLATHKFMVVALVVAVAGIVAVVFLR